MSSKLSIIPLWAREKYQANRKTYTDKSAETRKAAELEKKLIQEREQQQRKEKLQAIRRSTRRVYPVGMLHEIVAGANLENKDTILKLLTLLDSMDKREITCVAGGFVFKLVHGLPIGDSDIDVFLTTGTFHDIDSDPITNFGVALYSKFGYCQTKRSHWAVTYEAHGLPDIQLITNTRGLRSVRDVLESFDMNFCMYAIADSRVWAYSRRVHKDTCDRTLHFRLAYDYACRTNLTRALKYMGYAKKIDPLLPTCVTALLEASGCSIITNDDPRVTQARISFLNEYSLKNEDGYHKLGDNGLGWICLDESVWEPDPQIHDPNYDRFFYGDATTATTYTVKVNEAQNINPAAWVRYEPLGAVDQNINFVYEAPQPRPVRRRQAHAPQANQQAQNDWYADAMMRVNRMAELNQWYQNVAPAPVFNAAGQLVLNGEDDGNGG